MVGGGLSTNPMIAKRLGAFVRPEQVPEVWKAVCEVFRDYGYRRLRHRARIKFLVADWGAEKFREVLEKEYLGYALPDGPAPVNVDGAARDHVGVHRQRDGLSYVGFAPRVGRLNGEHLASIATLADRYGSGRVRTTAEQKMVILDVPDTPWTTWSPNWTRSACRSSRVSSGGTRWPAPGSSLQARDRGDQEPGHDTHRRARAAAAGFETPVTININGCPNSCARIQTADIGSRGRW